MISKTRTNFIVSLRKKKIRDQEKLFVIEGDKIVREFLQSGVKIQTLVAKPEFISSIPADQRVLISEVVSASYDELKKISTLTTPHNALSVVEMSEERISIHEIYKELSVALDFIQDPGNLGTLIRAAAWFGIRYIICSENCVDVYNPKVIQASMGAILNVKVKYCNLKEFLSDAAAINSDIYGTLLEGHSIYNSKLGKRGIILMGNESRGISDDLLEYVTVPLTIPKFTDAVTGIESLNVGMAASIIFSEFARRS